MHGIQVKQPVLVVVTTIPVVSGCNTVSIHSWRFVDILARLVDTVFHWLLPSFYQPLRFHPGLDGFPVNFRDVPVSTAIHGLEINARSVSWLRAGNPDKVWSHVHTAKPNQICIWQSRPTILVVADCQFVLRRVLQFRTFLSSFQYHQDLIQPKKPYCRACLVAAHSTQELAACLPLTASRSLLSDEVSNACG